MELTLNLLWAIIAAASYALLFRNLASRKMNHARGPSRSQCLIALTCVLAILFPVISLSDDLHEMQATLEEASSSVLVIKKCVVNRSSNPARTLHQVPFVLASFATSARRAVLGFVTAEQIARFSSAPHPSTLARAPPAFTDSRPS
jgi:hypothetical protein